MEETTLNTCPVCGAEEAWKTATKLVWVKGFKCGSEYWGHYFNKDKWKLINKCNVTS